MSSGRVLELGCGFSKTPGAFGIDVIPGSNADLIHDLNVFPYPVADSAWDLIICRDVLEHVDDFVRTMEEIWRIGAPGAIVEVRAPFMSSVNYYSDPTHRRAFTSRSFDYFLPGRPASRLQYSKARFELVSCEYDLGGNPAAPRLSCLGPAMGKPQQGEVRGPLCVSLPRSTTSPSSCA